MRDRKIKLSIKGQEVVCNFGINYHYEHYFNLTGEDLLVSGFEGISTVKMFKIIPALYCAAYMSQCSINGQQQNLTLEDFRHHVLSMDEAGAAKMMTDYTSLLAASKGEELAQTTTP